MQLSFHGATEEVTGSCFLVETPRAKVLIDCGMRQGERVCVLRSLEQFTFDPASLDAVLVTHAHFDHTGRLPELIARGFRGKIFSTPPTKALTDIILEDSLHIMEENAQRCGDPVPYGKEEKDQALAQMMGVGYHTAIEVAPGVSAMFHDAGHILGSAYITLDVTDRSGAAATRIAFSGDIGNDDVPILPDTEELSPVDIAVCEATYGDRDHDPAHVREDQLKEFVTKVIGRGGTVLIPAFSVERTQELLFALDRLVESNAIPEVPVYLDSPLAIRATAIYRHFSQYLHLDHPVMHPGGELFSFPRLHETMSRDESKAAMEDPRPKIIVAGNGMMTGGRIIHHLRHYLGDEKSGLLVVGFQAPGTLGRKILDGAPKVRVFGHEVHVALDVAMISAFSAHGDRKKLARWLMGAGDRLHDIFLIHGEQDSKASLAELLRKGTHANVTIPSLRQEFTL